MDGKSPAKKLKKEDEAVTIFRKYLRIKTVEPNPDYETANAFLKKYADDLGLPCQLIEVAPDKIVVVVTWEGRDSSLKSVILNSHIDVVPVYPEHWDYPPFEAIKTGKGDIYARGTQDMKCVGIQYMEAIRRLKAKNWSPLRTIHITFVPDEEIGGKLGMQAFIKCDHFKKMNVGFSLDEGLANPTDAFTVYYGERSPMWIKVKCPGKPGHGSRFIQDTAAEKIQKVINSFLAFRTSEEKKLKANDKLTLGDVTTVNMTQLSGGVAHNIVPAELSAVFDIRVTPTVDLAKFEETIKKWCQDAGEDVTYEYVVPKHTDQTMTSTSEKDPWWKAFSSACEDLDMELELEIFPAATDSRFLREAGIPALGFSPMNKTPILLHDHNEFLNEDIFLHGIDIYCKIIPAVAGVPKF